jgi:hypothetical protein
MPDKPDSKTRAAQLRKRIAQLKARKSPRPEPRPDKGPEPGESPHAYVERRMRETVTKKLP